MLLASIVLFTVATIGTLSTDGNLQVNEALAGGTCCPEDEAVCFPTGCNSSDCSIAEKYWRTDGKSCASPIAAAVDGIGTETGR